MKRTKTEIKDEIKKLKKDAGMIGLYEWYPEYDEYNRAIFGLEGELANLENDTTEYTAYRDIDQQGNVSYTVYSNEPIAACDACQGTYLADELVLRYPNANVVDGLIEN